MICCFDGKYRSITERQFLEKIAEDLQDFRTNYSGNSVLVFPPLDPHYRFLIHKWIESDQELNSVSVGQGAQRRTVVYFQTAAQRVPQTMSAPSHTNLKTYAGRGRGKKKDLSCSAISESEKVADHSSMRKRRPDQVFYVPGALRQRQKGEKDRGCNQAKGSSINVTNSAAVYTQLTSNGDGKEEAYEPDNKGNLSQLTCSAKRQSESGCNDSCYNNCRVYNKNTCTSSAGGEQELVGSIATEQQIIVEGNDVPVDVSTREEQGNKIKEHKSECCNNCSSWNRQNSLSVLYTKESCSHVENVVDDTLLLTVTIDHEQGISDSGCEKKPSQETEPLHFAVDERTTCNGTLFQVAGRDSIFRNEPGDSVVTEEHLLDASVVESESLACPVSKRAACNEMSFLVAGRDLSVRNGLVGDYAITEEHVHDATIVVESQKFADEERERGIPDTSTHCSEDQVLQNFIENTLSRIHVSAADHLHSVDCMAERDTKHLVDSSTGDKLEGQLVGLKDSNKNSTHNGEDSNKDIQFSKCGIEEMVYETGSCNTPLSLSSTESSNAIQEQSSVIVKGMEPMKETLDIGIRCLIPPHDIESSQCSESSADLRHVAEEPSKHCVAASPPVSGTAVNNSGGDVSPGCTGIAENVLKDGEIVITEQKETEDEDSCVKSKQTQESLSSVGGSEEVGCDLLTKASKSSKKKDKKLRDKSVRGTLKTKEKDKKKTSKEKRSAKHSDSQGALDKALKEENNRESKQCTAVRNKDVNLRDQCQIDNRNKAECDSADSDNSNDWESNFDENGECINPNQLAELSRLTGIQNPSIQKAQYDYYSSLKPREIELDTEEFGHIVEIYDFSVELTTQDLMQGLCSYRNKGFEVAWVDDTHALGIFSSHVTAQEAIRLCSSPLMKLRPVCEGTLQSKKKASNCFEYLQPYKERPQTSKLLADRMVTGALGVRSRISREERAKEREKIKEAQEKKRQVKLQKAQIWGD